MKNFSLMEFLAILSLIIIASIANLIILNDLGFVQMEKIVSKITKPSPLPNVPPASPVACTEEAKVCPDGSSVGRTGPNCEFATCPGEDNCAKEGEMISTMPTATEAPGKQCCSGLKEIPPDYLSSDKCTQIDDAAVCAYCPNGICGMGENQCNCPQDCKEIDTSGWQTYRNEEYGFEMKFPADLIRQGWATTEPELYWDGKLDGIPYVLTLGFVSQEQLNLMGITYCGAHPEDTRCENFSWDNLSATIDWNIGTEGTFTQSRAEIYYGGVIAISISHSPAQEIKSFFRQILSTFKFIP